MPLNDEIIEENSLESEESTSDNSTDYPADTDDPEVEGDDSLVQDDELGSSAPEREQPEPDEELDSSLENNSLSDNFTENHGTEVTYSSETLELYTDLEAFEASTIQVDLYQYTILNRLEFIQYALCIVIALLFLQIFVRYKK